MTIETTVFTFQISNTFEEWAKIFDSPEIDEFHKTVGLSPLYRGKDITNPKEAIVIHQASILFIISGSENIFLTTPYLAKGQKKFK